MEVKSKRKSQASIEDLPDEVLELILSFVPHYKGANDCMVVSRRWKECTSNVIKVKLRDLLQATSDFKMTWHAISPVPTAETITPRYSHAAAVYENSMYVFGGSTSSGIVFNDLWKLDLSKRQWVSPTRMRMNQRIVSARTIPSPKICCSMVNYKQLLIVFGGSTYKSCCGSHEAPHFLNELHTFNIVQRRWKSINIQIKPPEMLGHSVSIHRNNMVVFGGLINPRNYGHGEESNDVWKLNLETWQWQKQETIGHIQPGKRYWQSQVYLNDDNAFILGGCVGINTALSDAFVLNMEGHTCRWIVVGIRNPDYGPANLGGNPACKVGDKLIVLGRTRQQKRHNRIPIPVDVDKNASGERKTLKGLGTKNSDNCTRNKRVPKEKPVPVPATEYVLSMHILDISHVLDERPYVTWLQQDHEPFSVNPKPKLQYSFVKGNGEFIVFGGALREFETPIRLTQPFPDATNTLHFITAPTNVI